MDNRLEAAYWALRIALGAGMVTAGIDKFFDRLADWGMYLSPAVAAIVPLRPELLMRVSGIAEVALGAIVLGGLTRIGGYLLVAWLIAIAINLVVTGMFYDLAIRDIEIAVGAFALARLSEVRNASTKGDAS